MPRASPGDSDEATDAEGSPTELPGLPAFVLATAKGAPGHPVAPPPPFGHGCSSTSGSRRTSEEDPPCLTPTGGAAGQAYLERHRVPQFVDTVLQELMELQPDDPWTWLARRVAERRTQLVPPAPSSRPSFGNLSEEADRAVTCSSGEAAVASPTCSSPGPFDRPDAAAAPLSPTAYQGRGTAAAPMRRVSGLRSPLQHLRHLAACSPDPGSPSSPLHTVPPQNVLILVVGSHGDVRPFVALGRALLERGHRVRIATHVVFRDFVLQHGLDFFPIAGDAEELMKFMVQHPDLVTFSAREIEAKQHQMMEIFESTYLACVTPTTTETYRPDAIIANPPVGSHYHLAEHFQIPLHMMFTMPWTPTAAYPHPFASFAMMSLGNENTYTVVDKLIWMGCRSSINQFRQDVLRLPKLSGASGLLHQLRVPHTYCMSPALVPKPPDWGSNVDVVGFWFLDDGSVFDAAQEVPALVAFLEAGPPPVYIGFGSIVVSDPQELFQCLVKGVHLAGVRAIIHQGWAKLSDADLAADDAIFVLQRPVPHDWLFPHCAALCHHGGAGSVAAGLRAGRPTLVVPFFGDQLFWGRVVAREGVGPPPVPRPRLTPDTLADGLRACLAPAVRRRAEEVGARIRAEDGLARGVAAFEAGLPLQGGHWVCEVWENQRWYWAIGWSNRLLPGDRYNFSDETGLQSRSLKSFPLPPGWQWDGGWEQEILPDRTDEEGFEYATGWRGPWHADSRWGDGVRRRRWVRTRSVRFAPCTLPAPRLHSTRVTLLYVTVLEGLHLLPEDGDSGLYVRMYILRDGRICQKQRTKVVRQSACPRWGQTFFFACLVGDLFRIDCRAQHRRSPAAYHLVGCAEVPLDGLCLDVSNAYDMWTPLRSDGPVLHVRWTRDADPAPPLPPPILLSRSPSNLSTEQASSEKGPP